MLNLTKAFELYDILAPYLPSKPEEGEIVVAYVRRILANMMGKDEDAYTRAMMVLTGLSRQELVSLPVKDVLNTFMMKLSECRILELQRFMKEIGK